MDHSISIRPSFEDLFKPASNQQAFLKAGFLGWQGSGKTFTAVRHLGLGLIQVGRQRGQQWAERPMLFIDSEHGSDWVQPVLKSSGVEMFVLKTRSFARVVEACELYTERGSLIVIDSATHYWRDLVTAYKVAKNRRFMEFQDWDEVKGDEKGWGRLMRWFIDAPAHVILCGRAGHIYEEHEREDAPGKTKLVKVGTKMRAEGETGYEASLLVQMDRAPGEEKELHVATVVKDRSDRLDGKQCADPTYDFFAPHVDFLNLGGEHGTVSADRGHTESMFGDDHRGGAEPWRIERAQKTIVLEELQEELSRQWPTTSNVDKAAKAAMVEKLFGTRSWSAVEARELRVLKAARDLMWRELRGQPYNPENKGTAHEESLRHMAGGLDLPPEL